MTTTPKLLTAWELADLAEFDMDDAGNPLGEWHQAQNGRAAVDAFLSHIAAQAQEIERWRLLFDGRVPTDLEEARENARDEGLELSATTLIQMGAEPTITVEAAGRWLVGIEADLAAMTRRAEKAEAASDSHLRRADEIMETVRCRTHRKQCWGTDHIGKFLTQTACPICRSVAEREGWGK